MAALLTSICDGRRKGELGGPFLTCVNLLLLLFTKKKKNVPVVVIVKCERFRVERSVWEQFSFKASGSQLAYVALRVKSLCLLVNN